jgi:photosystem II stability/assembly factor-like uncharacterized protein
MVKKIAVDRSSPVGNRTLYAATSLGFCKSRDHGNSWASGGKGLPGENLREVTCLFDKAAKKTTVLVLMETGGVYRSEDGGETFKASGEGLGKKEDGSDVLVNALGASWTDGKIVYACGKHWWKSTDAGKTWAKIYEKANKLGSWLTVYKPWSQDGGYGVGCNPKDPNQVWFTGVMQFFSSNDGGATLVEANSHPYPDDNQRTSFTGNDSWQVVKKGPTVFDGGGLEVINCYEVYKDPFQPKTWWAGYADVGGWKTEDEGKSWQYALGYWNHGIKSEWRNSTYAFAFDLKQPGRVYAAQSGVHDLPGKDVGDGDKGVGGVAVSNDNGKTWTPFEKNGLPEKICTSVVVDARDSNLLYSALYTDGVYRSPDAGKNWERISEGLPSPIRAWRLRQAPDNALYLICANKKPGGIWKLDESAKKWSRVDSNFESVLDLVTGPKGFMAVAVGGTQGGVHASDDNGKTWKKLYSGEAMSVDFSADKRVWVIGGRRGVIKSLDGGATWTESPDVPFPFMNHVKLNPKNPGEVWLGSAGCGVIKGPVQ